MEKVFFLFFYLFLEGISACVKRECWEEENIFFNIIDCVTRKSLINNDLTG